MDKLSRLASCGVIALITFLAYGSQIVFSYIEPGPLKRHENYIFNSLVGCLWISYARACCTDPGFVPRSWKPMDADSRLVEEKPTESTLLRSRWCRKCEAFKPPRAHHCKVCQRCIPKMDHHCPWTINCVSHRTLAHFLRFLVFAVISMCYLESFLYERAAVVWDNRNLPSYLGPSLNNLLFLALLCAVNSLTLFAVGVTLMRSGWAAWMNITTIESWEIDRHKTLVRRAKVLGGYLDGPNGIRVRIKRQEFPYDIGFYANLTQALGANPLIWFWPLAFSLPNESGLKFEVNGFEGEEARPRSVPVMTVLQDASTTWPPPDPDRIPRKSNPRNPPDTMHFMDMDKSDEDWLKDFRIRQLKDVGRLEAPDSINKRRRFHDRYSSMEGEIQEGRTNGRDDIEGEEAWRNAEGESLNDFGVEQDTEFYDEDDLPLASLLAKARSTKA